MSYHVQQKLDVNCEINRSIDYLKNDKNNRPFIDSSENNNNKKTST